MWLYKALHFRMWLQQKQEMTGWRSASQLQVCRPLTTLKCHPLTVIICLVSRVSLSSTGHARVESVTVTSYIYTEDQVKPCEGEACLEYLRDVAQEAAEYLSANRDHLGPRSHLEVLKRFSTRAADEELSAEGSDCSEEDVQLRQSSGDETGFRHLDEKITLAMANMDYPQQWENTESQPREGNEIGRVRVQLTSCGLVGFSLAEVILSTLQSLPVTDAFWHF